MKINGENGGFDFMPPVSYDGRSGAGKLEAVMVNAGALVSYTAGFCTSKVINRAVKLLCDAKKAVRPVKDGAGKKLSSEFRKICSDIAGKAKAFAAFNVKFAGRIREYGFVQAVKLQCSDTASAFKRNRSIFRTIVNYTVPTASLALLAGIVYNTASTSYGITVEYNGTELGVVTAESVVADAQQTISDKAVYYSTEDEILVTANLSIKPLNAMDEVIDEVALAEKMEEQISVQSPEVEFADNDETAARAAADIDETADETAEENSGSHDEMDGKVRAYAVMINGEFYGAVEETNKIEGYLDSIKARYQGDNVVSVGFDKSVEYGYEQYVYPGQIMTEEEIIEKLGSIVSEPVYYEVQNGDNPWNIARDNDLSLDELKGCFTTFEGEQIEDITKFCPVGATIQLSAEVPFLQTLVTKSVTYTDEIDYETVTTEDPNMYKGDTAVDVKGVEGEAEYKALITYKNDVAVSKEILEEKIISAPVSEEIRVGTRQTTTEVSTGSGGSGEYFWPVDGGYISAYQGDGRGHKGIDIAAPYGTPIYAAQSGTVTRAANKYDGYGNSVMISHSDGNVTMYAHMSSIAISYGDYVVKGQLIGYVGSTGDSTGNHLHFEVRSGGYYIDPTEYVSQY